MPTSLTKSDFRAGSQCHKRLYLQKHHPELAPPAPGEPHRRAEEATDVRILGRRYFPGGTLIDSATGDPLEGTAQAINIGVETIYEATFCSDAAGAYAKCDILRRIPGGWHLVEVTSATKPDEKYVRDAAFKVYVSRASGLPVKTTSILHINNKYVYPGGDYDVVTLFTETDVTAKVEAMMPSIENDIERFRTILDSYSMPIVETNRHCESKVPCEFHAYCHANQPEHDVIQLPSIRANQVSQYRLAGYYSIPDIPETEIARNAHWSRIWEVLRSGNPYFGTGLGDELAKVAYPLHFMDFETVSSALPLYAGTRPYQQVLFQWSNHIIDEPGAEVRHEEFLHTSAGDPRPAFAETLWKSIRDARIIVIYTGFETLRLKDLANDGIPWGAELYAKLTDCVLDIKKVVKDHSYHADFKGSFSIKDVLPALVPELSYADLAIHDGDTASVRYLEMQGFRPSDQAPEEIAANLLTYCCLDTLAMVKIFEVLAEKVTTA